MTDKTSCFEYPFSPVFLFNLSAWPFAMRLIALPSTCEPIKYLKK